jgi:hypothetical protein
MYYIYHMQDILVKTAVPFSYRPPRHLAGLFNDVVLVSKRTKASILTEALDEALPKLANRWRIEIEQLHDSNQQTKAS